MYPVLRIIDCAHITIHFPRKTPRMGKHMTVTAFWKKIVIKFNSIHLFHSQCISPFVLLTCLPSFAVCAKRKKRGNIAKIVRLTGERRTGPLFTSIALSFLFRSHIYQKVITQSPLRFLWQSSDCAMKMVGWRQCDTKRDAQTCARRE